MLEEMIITMLYLNITGSQQYRKNPKRGRPCFPYREVINGIIYKGFKTVILLKPTEYYYGG